MEKSNKINEIQDTVGKNKIEMGIKVLMTLVKDGKAVIISPVKLTMPCPMCNAEFIVNIQPDDIQNFMISKYHKIYNLLCPTCSGYFSIDFDMLIKALKIWYKRNSLQVSASLLDKGESTDNKNTA